MAKLTLNEIANVETSEGALNTNFDLIEAELQNKVLYRNNPPGEPNAMEVDFDMNGKRILNLPAPIDPSEPARLRDLQEWDIGQIGTPSGAALVGFSPTAGIIATHVQSAIEEVRADSIAYVDGLRSDLSTPGGAALVGTASGDTVESVLNAQHLTNYTALREYTGNQKAVYITGYLVSAAPSGTAGLFTRDDSDTTSTDNGGTIIVASNGKRWKRVYDGAINVKWFGAKRDLLTDDAPSFNAAILWLNSIGGGELYVPSGTYRLKSTIQFKAGVNIIGESMINTTLKWHPDTDTPGDIITTTNQSLGRVSFKNLRFIKDASITGNVTGIVGGSTLVNYNSAVATFENLHFDTLTYGIRGNAEPTGVGIFDCYFKNVWCSSCFFGLWLFGSGNRIDHPRMTYCDFGIALDYLNAESFDGHTITGGVFVGNSYDIGVRSAFGIRPTKIIGTWFEQSTNGIINVENANTRVMNLDFIGCLLSTSSTVTMFNVAGALGTVTVDRCTLYSGGVGKAQSFVRPTAAGGRLIITDCQKYDSSGVASLVSDKSYFEAVKSGVDQSISSATATKITWDAATIDSASGFDNANDRYVVQAPGIYRVSACVSFPNQPTSTSQNKVSIYKNGAQHRTSIGAASSGTYTTERIECLVSCAAGDYLEILATQNSGSALNISGASDLTYFAVEYVRTL